MSSGVFRSTGDLLTDCLCGWFGWVEAVEDLDRLSLTWVCPGCGSETEEDYR